MSNLPMRKSLSIWMMCFFVVSLPAFTFSSYSFEYIWILSGRTVLPLLILLAKLILALRNHICFPGRLVK